MMSSPQVVDGMVDGSEGGFKVEDSLPSSDLSDSCYNVPLGLPRTSLVNHSLL